MHIHIYINQTKSYLSFSVKSLTLGDGKVLVKVTSPVVHWSSDPEHLHNARQACWQPPITLAFNRHTQQSPWVCCLAGLRLGELQVQQETLPQKMQWRVIKEGAWCQLWAYTCIHRHMHVHPNTQMNNHTHMHTTKYTCKEKSVIITSSLCNTSWKERKKG